MRRFFFRVYPDERMKWEHVKILDDKKTVYCRRRQEFLRDGEDCEPSFWRFETDGVFVNNTQEEIYNVVMDGVLESVMQGNNAIILAYGQTGAGKSLTVNGFHNCYVDRGIACRVVTDLFKIKANLDKNRKMAVLVSCIESTKLFATDLLSQDRRPLDCIQIKNVSAKKVRNEHEALKEIFTAEGLREYASNSSYDSHIAHGIITLHVITICTDMSAPTRTTAKLHIIDLAGQDTYGNATCSYKNSLDVGVGNLAKTLLEQFLLTLCTNVPGYIAIKQRTNILLQYLGDSLNNFCIMRFIGHIRITRENLLITLSMLRFAQLFKGLKSKGKKPNVTINENMKLCFLQKELEKYKVKEELEAMFSNNNLSVNINQDRMKHLQNMVQDYLEDKTPEIAVLNVMDADAVLKLFKNFYRELEAQKNECVQMMRQKALSDAAISVESSAYRADLSIRSMKPGKTKPKEKWQGGKVAGKKDEKIKGGTKNPSSKRDTISLRSVDAPSKRSKASGSAVGKQGKRRSTTNLQGKSEAKRENTLAEAVEEEPPLPSALPTRDEAWQQYENDENSNYAHLRNIAENQELQARERHAVYMSEVKKLHEAMRTLDSQKEELLQVNMHSHYTETSNGRDSDFNFHEMLCVESVQVAEEEVVHCQEKVLKEQVELRIAIDAYQAADKAIKEDFDKFCVENYGVHLPSLQSISTIFDHLEPKQPEEESANAEQEAIKVTISAEYLQHEHMQKLMRKKMTQKTLEMEKRRKWVQPYNMFKL